MIDRHDRVQGREGERVRRKPNEGQDPEQRQTRRGYEIEGEGVARRCMEGVWDRVEPRVQDCLDLGKGRKEKER